jgi:hypothetical protein
MSNLRVIQTNDHLENDSSFLHSYWRDSYLLQPVLLPNQVFSTKAFIIYNI